MSFDIILWIAFGVFLAIALYRMNKELFGLTIVLVLIIGVVAITAYNQHKL